MARVHLVVGPVGAGKSTHAARLRLEHNAVCLTLDEWMTVLFRPDRPPCGVMEWYTERCERCVEQIWRVAEAIMQTGTDVVLEIGLIQRHQREKLYWWVDSTDHELTIHVLDAPREVRRARVEHRNRERGETFSMEVPPEIFELASDSWEPLSEAECRGRDVRFMSAE